jgi:hypothetical protein
VREGCARTGGRLAEGELIMMLIIWYLALVAVGDVLAYFGGLFVEYEWGSNASVIVFLSIYFVTLWVAWVIAVRLTGPKKETA